MSLFSPLLGVVPNDYGPLLNTELLFESYVQINRVWDRMSKSLICLVDAMLNWYFLKNVKVRLVEEAGLLKYQALVDFNTKLMVLSVLSDVSL